MQKTGAVHHHVWSAITTGASPGSTERESLTGEVFRRVFRRHPAGVAIVCASDGGRPVGLTVTSLSSLSAAPPLISFGVGRRASAWAAVCAAEYFAVHLIAEDQQELAATFARSGADRFAPPTRWSPGPFGVPVLDDVPAALVCRKVYDLPTGDHTLVIGEPVHAVEGGAARPLVYLDGRYGSVSR